MASESNNKPLKTMKDRLFSLAGFGDTRKSEKGLPPKTHFSIWYFILAILFFSYLQPLFFSAQVDTISYSQFKQHLADGKLDKLSIRPDQITDTLRGVPDLEITTVRVDDPGLMKELDESKVNYSGQYRSKFLGATLSWVLPLGIFFLIWRFAIRKMGPGMGLISFSKSEAKIFAKSDTKVTFEDVARAMVTQYGMSDCLGLVSYEQAHQAMFLPEGFGPDKNYSEAKAAEIDEEIARLVEEAHQRVQKIILERRNVLNELAQLLSVKKSVHGDELRKMLAASEPAEI